MITIFNGKGGVGKTTLAFSLASIYEMKYTTNDYSVSLDILEDTVFKEDLTIDNINGGIVDLGGYITQDTLDILYASDVILIPVTSDINAIHKTNALLEELLGLDVGFDNKIIIVASNIKDKNDYSKLKKGLDNKGLPIKKIMHSKLFVNAIENGKSIVDTIESSPLMKKNYEKVTFQIQDLIEEIESL